MLLILCLMSLFAQSFARLNGTGSCDPFLKPRNFDYSRFLGTWIEYGRTANPFEDDHECSNFTHYVDENNKLKLNVDGTIRIPGARYIFEGLFSPTNTSGVFDLKYPKYATLDQLPSAYIDANWDYFTIYVLCSEQNGGYQLYVWILTKEKDISQQIYDEIATALERINVSWNDFELPSNQNCPKRRPLVSVPDSEY